MRVFYLLLISLIATFVLAYPYDGKVLVLATQNFLDVKNEFRFVLVNFYDPDMTSQNYFQEEFALAAEKAEELYPGLKLAKMNSVVNEIFASKFNVGDSSTAKLFIDGNHEHIDYDGGENAADIISWLENKIESSLITLESSRALNELLSKKKHVALFFGSKYTNEFSQFLGVSTLYKDYISFAYSNDESILEEFELEDNSFTVFRNYNEEVNFLPGPFSTEDLEDFIDVYTYPVVMRMDTATSTRVFKKKADAIFLVRRLDSAGDEAEAAFRKLAETYRTDLAFAIGISGEEYTEKLIGMMGIDKNELPAIRIMHSSDSRKKYCLDREPSQKNIEIFILNFLEANLVPYYRSGPVTEREYDGHVKIIVSTTYREIVFDETKDVVVEFYSPKCGHCQAFAPAYEFVASKLKNTKDLLFTKIDATVNDVEGITPPGYPYVLYYPGGDKKQPIEFSGDRAANTLLDFIRKQATVRIKE